MILVSNQQGIVGCTYQPTSMGIPWNSLYKPYITVPNIWVFTPGMAAKLSVEVGASAFEKTLVTSVALSQGFEKNKQSGELI